jgi:hypothetical protein
MLLQDKHAVVYGAGGPIGGRGHTFTHERATVSLAGRTRWGWTIPRAAAS